MMKQMKDPVNNLDYWVADLFLSHHGSLCSHGLWAIWALYVKNIDIGSKAMKEAAMIEAEMEEMNDQEDNQA